MIDKRISEEETAILQSIIGTQFISYECGMDEMQFNRAYGNIYLNFTNHSIELENIEKPTIYCGETDDMSGFSCSICSSEEKFKPYIDEDTVVREISEIVTGVEIVEDTVHINNSECEISFSSAIIIRTQKQNFMFYRTYQYNENIFISDSDSYDKVYPVSNVEENWNNDGENQVFVERHTRCLAG